MIVVYFFYVNAGDKKNVDYHSQNSLHETPRPPLTQAFSPSPRGRSLAEVGQRKEWPWARRVCGGGGEPFAPG